MILGADEHNLSERISFYLSSEMRQRLLGLGEGTRIPVSSIIREFVQIGIDRTEKLHQSKGNINVIWRDKMTPEDRDNLLAGGWDQVGDEEWSYSAYYGDKRFSTEQALAVEWSRNSELSGVMAVMNRDGLLGEIHRLRGELHLYEEKYLNSGEDSGIDPLDIVETVDERISRLEEKLELMAGQRNMGKEPKGG